MTGAIAPLGDWSHWARSNLLVIVLLVLGAILLTRFAVWARDRFVARIDARHIEADELVRSEAAKHRQVVAQVLTWTALAVIYFVAAVLIVQNLGVPLAGLVAPAALISAALGFGLQRFVQDIGAGLFITGERQYGFGDVVRISITGSSPQVTGTVEDVTLRVTRLRSVSGEVITTPNGQISQVTNLSRDWARAVIDVPVPVRRRRQPRHPRPAARRRGGLQRRAAAQDDARPAHRDGRRADGGGHVLGADGGPDAARHPVRRRP